MRHSLLLATAAALSLFALEAQASEARLKQNIQIDGAQVTFADLFENAGPAGGKVFSAAPQPGERVTYKPQTVQIAAQSVGIAWDPDPGLRGVSISRGGRSVPREEILGKLARAMQIADAEDGSVMISGSINLVVPRDAEPSVAIEDLDYDRFAKRFSATLVAPAGARDAQRLRVQGRVQQLSEIPVLKSALGAGQVIGKDDIEYLSMPNSRLGGNVVADAAELIGLSARRALPPGRPLRAGDVQRPVMVAKGALISMTVTSPNMQLTTTGRAIDAGAKGEVIQVMNMQSKKTVTGTIIGPNQVEVGVTRVLSASN